MEKIILTIVGIIVFIFLLDRLLGYLSTDLRIVSFVKKISKVQNKSVNNKEKIHIESEITKEKEVIEEIKEDEHTRLKREVEELKREAETLGLPKILDEFYSTLKWNVPDYYKELNITNISKKSSEKLGEIFSFTYKNTYQLAKTNPSDLSIPDDDSYTTSEKLTLMDNVGNILFECTIFDTHYYNDYEENTRTYSVEGYKKGEWTIELREMSDAISKTKKQITKNQQSIQKEKEIQELKSKFGV